MLDSNVSKKNTYIHHLELTFLKKEGIKRRREIVIYFCSLRMIIQLCRSHHLSLRIVPSKLHLRRSRNFHTKQNYYPTLLTHFLCYRYSPRFISSSLPQKIFMFYSLFLLSSPLWQQLNPALIIPVIKISKGLKCFMQLVMEVFLAHPNTLWSILLYIQISKKLNAVITTQNLNLNFSVFAEYDHFQFEQNFSFRWQRASQCCEKHKVYPNEAE